MSIRKPIKFIVLQPNRLDAPLTPDALIDYDAWSRLECPYCQSRPDHESYHPNGWRYICGTSIKYSYNYSEFATDRNVYAEFIRSDCCTLMVPDNEDDVI